MERQFMYTVGMDENLYSYHEKNGMKFPLKTIIWSNNTTSECVFKVIEINILRDVYFSVFKTFFARANIRSPFKWSTMNEWINKMWYRYATKYYSFKMEKSCLCKNMSKFGGHYTKWNKPGTDRQVLMISLMCGI